MSSLDLLDQNNATVLLIDHNNGFGGTVGSGNRTLVSLGAAALARTAKIFDLPLVVTNADPKGAGGDLVTPLRKELGDTKVLIRPDGVMDSMEDDAVAAAVRAAGRPKLVLAGVLTEVCATLATLTALKQGYEVYVAHDACGGLTPEGHTYGIQRMIQAGAIPASWASITAELQLRWDDSKTPGRTKPTAGDVNDLIIRSEANWGNLSALHADLLQP